jgi:hypothetical protein
MEGKAALPGSAEQQQALAPTPSMQPAAHKVKFSYHKTKFILSFQIPVKVQSEISKFLEPIIIKDPPSEYEFMIEPPSISAYDLYVFFLCNIH